MRSPSNATTARNGAGQSTDLKGGLIPPFFPNLLFEVNHATTISRVKTDAL